MAQRYDIWINYDTMETDKDNNGDWVKYDDHAAEITQLRADFEQERALADRLAEELSCRVVVGDENPYGDLDANSILAAHATRRNK